MDRSHIVIIAIVAAFSTHFFFANRKQSTGKKVIENTVNTPDSVDEIRFHGLTAATGRLPLHILRLC